MEELCEVGFLLSVGWHGGGGVQRKRGVCMKQERGVGGDHGQALLNHRQRGPGTKKSFSKREESGETRGEAK